MTNEHESLSPRRTARLLASLEDGGRIGDTPAARAFLAEHFPGEEVAEDVETGEGENWLDSFSVRRVYLPARRRAMLGEQRARIEAALARALAAEAGFGPVLRADDRDRYSRDIERLRDLLERSPFPREDARDAERLAERAEGPQ